MAPLQAFAHGFCVSRNPLPLDIPLVELLPLLLLLVELDADKHLQKKPFNFMSRALGHIPSPVDVRFLNIPLIYQYPTHFSICHSFLDIFCMAFAPGWTEGVSPGVWEIVVAGCLGDSSGRVSDKP